ncbi:hypothetical protein UFOVP903_9 [uncultured Caudovirales phage]|uniref:DUF5681 domain-containing protein n=1 Tax=uncultured Caudovirales phage TaxID=2100421 RepID=A0A6J5PIH9_9CAUD|nr:hypothetical protein UFOVP903_9 [uncultured Caudovirales phage]CAB4197800.1 hypothetical protein UFOVP1318_37 [uncultured Caudovirales phage]CAB4210331.1 hypothetical protein UFOVP1430_7 [uncultured Caudovirales phage]
MSEPKKKQKVSKEFENAKWKKGQSGNPAGKPPLPEDVKAARKLTAVEFERICANLFTMSTRRLTEVAKNPSTPVLTALVARILEKGLHESSRVELNFFIERFLGKVPDNQIISGNLNGSLTDFIGKRTKKKDESDEGFE